MLSDGFHSAVHALGGVISLIGVKLAARPPDERHPYGYEPYEPLAAMGVAVLMFIAVWKMGYGFARATVIPDLKDI
jgi:divalent metal cation (Fe/Co/Zn/Cd) transporter